MRRFFALLALVLLTLGVGLAGESEAASLRADDCCPSSDEGADDDGDCCDVDQGLCCAGATCFAVSASPATPPFVAPPAALPTRRGGVLRALRGQLRGPPPTPPPIG